MLNQLHKKRFIIIMLFAAIFVMTGTVLIKNYDFSPNELTTDSGFDSDFGGGGSSSSSSSHSKSSGTSEFDIFGAITIEIVLTIFFWLIVFKGLNPETINFKLGKKIYYARFIFLIIGNVFAPYLIILQLDAILFLVTTITIATIFAPLNNNDVFDTKDVSIEQLQVYGIKENIDELKNKVYAAYVEIQEAWSENNIDKARHLLSDTMYNTYKMQIITMINKNQRNAMSDFKYIGAYINDISKTENSIIIKTSLNVQCRDYLVDITNGKTIRGNQNIINDYYYSLTFTLGESNNVTNCPNCNSKLSEHGTSIKCEHCGSIIEREIDELILIDKKMVKQSTKK